MQTNSLPSKLACKPMLTEMQTNAKPYPDFENLYPASETPVSSTAVQVLCNMTGHGV